MSRLTLFPDPTNENQHWIEIAYQLGVSEGKTMGRREGIRLAQAGMREAQTVVQGAMGIMEDLGA